MSTLRRGRSHTVHYLAPGFDGSGYPHARRNTPCGFDDRYSDHLTRRISLVTCPTCRVFTDQIVVPF